MSNSYATVPAIIPGDLQVQGNLTVAGGNFILGRLQRKYRIQERGNGNFIETVNVDRNVPAQDDPSSTSQVRQMNPTASPFAVMTQSPGTPATDTSLLYIFSNEFQVFLPSLRVGAATPYVRVMNQPGTIGGWSCNLQNDYATRDNTSLAACSYEYNASQQSLQERTVDAAGNGIIANPPRMFWYDHGAKNITGVTGLQTIGSRTIYANELGINGGIYVVMYGLVATGTGGSCGMAWNWGGTSTLFYTIPAVTSSGFVLELWISNQNTLNTQRGLARINLVTSIIQSSLIPYSVATGSLNTTLSLTCTNGIAADQLFVSGIEGYYICRPNII